MEGKSLDLELSSFLGIFLLIFDLLALPMESISGGWIVILLTLGSLKCWVSGVYVYNSNSANADVLVREGLVVKDLLRAFSLNFLDIFPVFDDKLFDSQSRSSWVPMRVLSELIHGHLGCICGFWHIIFSNKFWLESTMSKNLLFFSLITLMLNIFLLFIVHMDTFLIESSPWVLNVVKSWQFWPKCCSFGLIWHLRRFFNLWLWSRLWSRLGPLSPGFWALKWLFSLLCNFLGHDILLVQPVMDWLISPLTLDQKSWNFVDFWFLFNLRMLYKVSYVIILTFVIIFNFSKSTIIILNLFVFVRIIIIVVRAFIAKNFRDRELW